MTTDPLSVLDQLDEAHAKATLSQYRVGEHYGIHLYAGDRPVGTTLIEDDAALIVAAVNALPDLVQRARRLHALQTAVLALADELKQWARINAQLSREDTAGPDLHDGMRRAQEITADRIRSTVTAALAAGGAQ